MAGRESEQTSYFEIERGVPYSIKEARSDMSYALFRQLLADGLHGLIVTRKHPRGVRKKLPVADVRMVWLTSALGEDFHNPTALATLARTITGFIEEHDGKAVVLLDGLECLVQQNTFRSAYLWLALVGDCVMTREAVLLVPVRPDAFETKNHAVLERELEPIEPPVVRLEREIRKVREKLGLLDVHSR